jgi:hypothetical protein
MILYGKEPNTNGLTKIQRCHHTTLVGVENYDDLNISFCSECGTIVIMKWHNQTEAPYISYVFPQDVNFLLEFYLSKRNNE